MLQPVPHTSRGARSLLIGLLALVGSLVGDRTDASVLDDIEVRTLEGVAEVRLVFTTPVHYIKHFPANEGELIKLYLQAVSLDGFSDGNAAFEQYKRTPRIPLVPPFTISYSTARSCFAARDPLCLDIQFDRPVRFTLQPDPDGRSIIILMLPENAPKPASTKSQP